MIGLRVVLAAQQVIGREGETATFIKRNFVSQRLRVSGFAPRQLNRSVFRVCKRQRISLTNFLGFLKFAVFNALALRVPKVAP